MQFELFRAMHKVRSFHLVLSASLVDDYSVRELKQAVEVGRAMGGPQISMSYTLRKC